VSEAFRDLGPHMGYPTANFNGLFHLEIYVDLFAVVLNYICLNLLKYVDIVFAPL
jgi:hypothetical protein